MDTLATNTFKRLLRSHGEEPRKIATDKLRSYGVAHREIMPDVIHDTSRYATNNKFDPTSPFGGYKESGVGREGGLHGLDAYVKLGAG